MMARYRWLAVVGVLLAGCVTGPGGGMGAGGAQRIAATAPEFQKAIDAVYPALVRVEIVTPVFQEGREIRIQAGGSGVIISPDGYVVTNHHVAGRATSIVCVLPNKEEIRAERAGTDPLTDICVLKLTKARMYPHAQFGDSTRLKVGDRVLAMGSPASVSQSVTAGIVSNTDLILPGGMGARLILEGENVGALVKWIAHDAAIFPGNSGGPLVSLDGRIVGINELGLGLSAAIPGNLAQSVADELIRHGQVKRSWLGIVTQPLLKSSGRDRGVLLSGVFPDSPAADAGLRPGDIILSYAGTPVTARFGEDMPVFTRLVAGTPVGQKVAVTVERDGVTKTFELTTRLRSEASSKDREVLEWGMVARNLTEMSARQMKRKGTDGVLVANVRPGGPCSEAKPGIDDDDVIVQVNGKPVRNVEELAAATDAIVKDQADPVPTLVAFERKNEQWLTIVKVGIRKLADRSPDARRAWLPASIQVLTTDLAGALGVKGVTGVRLTDVFEGGSAAEAGLKVGDIITAIDGERIAASKPEDADVFPAMVRQRNVGQEVKLTVVRAGKELAVPVKLERSPKATREMKRHQSTALGFTVRDLSDEDHRSMKIEKEVSGPLIAEVEPGSLAAVGDLHVSDIVLSVDGQPTPDVAALKKQTDEIEKKKPPRTVFFVKRGVTTTFVEVETPWLSGKK